jgi:hypothetical protein
VLVPQIVLEPILKHMLSKLFSSCKIYNSIHSLTEAIIFIIKKFLPCSFESVVIEADFGEAEVNESDVSGRIEHQVFRLQVAEDDAVLVQELQRQVDLRKVKP